MLNAQQVNKQLIFGSYGKAAKIYTRVFSLRMSLFSYTLKRKKINNTNTLIF